MINQHHKETIQAIFNAIKCIKWSNRHNFRYHKIEEKDKDLITTANMFKKTPEDTINGVADILTILKNEPATIEVEKLDLGAAAILWAVLDGLKNEDQYGGEFYQDQGRWLSNYQKTPIDFDSEVLSQLDSAVTKHIAKLGTQELANHVRSGVEDFIGSIWTFICIIVAVIIGSIAFVYGALCEMFSSHHSEHAVAETSPLVAEPAEVCVSQQLNEHREVVQSPVSNYSEVLRALVKNFEEIMEEKESQVHDFTYNGQPLNLTIRDKKVCCSKMGPYVVENGKLVLTLTAIKQVYQVLGKEMPIDAMSKYAEQSQSMFRMFPSSNEVQQAVANMVEEYNNTYVLTM
tara:strand:- start:929 stop:1966 length:1038 start_codon:yes stop_codon:yes gene_type:complete